MRRSFLVMLMATATALLPAAASAQDQRPDRPLWGRQNGSAPQQREARQPRGDNGGGETRSRPDRQPQGPPPAQFQDRQPRQFTPPPAAVAPPQNGENGFRRGDGRGQGRAQGNGGDRRFQGQDGNGFNPALRDGRGSAAITPSDRDGSGFRRDDQRFDRNGQGLNRDGRGFDRDGRGFDRDGRDGRDGRFRDGRDNRNFRDRNGGFDRRDNGNRGTWNRGWRNNNQYNWQYFRNSNRNAFHLPRYYAPYGWNYGYRRFGIGFSLSSILFSQNYWISDPDYYRLPPAYYPYRWVRYYNDALLVDIETGEVVDTVYDIFW